ncbi:MAG TPA: CHAT domain-containing tetratricopeptide repeat protein, partial [Thermoanaerobaculia bacterium]|nr:CHAT domain-containing tetratricopeptide repeat protein [Thermoanaerobaculia bacterium]
QVLAEGDALDPRRRAALRVNTGVVYRNLGDPVSALAAFREAVTTFEREEDRAALSNAWLNIGLVQHLNLERPRAAEEAYRKALGYAEASGDRTEEIQDLFYLGRLLLDRGRLDEAARVFERCLAASERSGSAEGRWSALDGLGRIAAARGEPGRALERFERAMDEIERVRSALPRPSLRFHFFGDKRPIYAAAVEVLAGLERTHPGAGHAERALEIAQRAKSRELLDALTRTRRRPVPLTAAGLRQRIGGDVLLEYFLGERHLYLWAVRDSGVRMADLGPSAPLLAQALEAHRGLSRGETPSAATTAALSRALLGPAGPLPRSPGQTRIAPDGGLRYLPFELLVDTTTVSYLPSGSALAWLDPTPRKTAVALLGFGNPEMPSGDFRLPPLPATVRELTAIARQFPGEEDLYLGPRATEAAFREAVSRGARVVHLATHTVIDERPGRSTAILLTPQGDDDGLLSPDEISALPYGADLTVLAACSTALSPESGGGGALASLTGAFLAAGSPAVVATLWDVGDTASAAFMEQLYHQLGQGHTPAEALRRAKETLRADPRWSRPALWAGYVLIGEGPRLAPRRPGLPWVVTAVLLAGELVALWAVKRRRNARAR